jgi:hypothetical protein
VLYQLSYTHHVHPEAAAEVYKVTQVAGLAYPADPDSGAAGRP